MALSREPVLGAGYSRSAATPHPLHLAFLVMLLLLVFGAKRLPEMGRSFGAGMRGFRESISGESSPSPSSGALSSSAQPATPTPLRSPSRTAHVSSPWLHKRTAPPSQQQGSDPRAHSQTLELSGRRMPNAIRSIGHEDRLSLVGHLTELRARLIVALAVLAIAFGICFWQNHALLHLLNRPLAHQTQRQLQDGRGPLGATYAVTQGSRDVAIQLQAVVGLLRAPDQTSGARGTRDPGPHRRRAVRPLMFTVPGLFAAGALFGYLVVLPAAVHFFQNFNSAQFNVLVQANRGIMAITRWADYTSPVTPKPPLRDRRVWHDPALLPSDAITLVLEIVPLYLLFEVSLLIATIAERRSRSRGPAQAKTPEPVLGERA